MAMHEVEAWILVANDGQCAVAGDEEACTEKAGEDDVPLCGSRMICVKLQVEVPEPMTVEATIPAKDGKVTMTVTG